MKHSSIGYGIFAIFSANMINLIFNLLTNFLLPKYLSVEAYAQIKTFLMYVGYVGVLHLGYSDGMYLRYGGVQITPKIREALSTDIKTMRNFQLLVGILFLTVALFSRNPVLIASAIAIIPVNMTNYYKYLLQATGEFQSYSRILNFITISTAVPILGLLLAGIREQYDYYLLVYLLVDVGICFYLEWVATRKYKLKSCSFSVSESIAIFTENIRDGFFLMLGTFSSIILTGMDRWFIKVLMDNTAFAMYSFAVSMEGLMDVAVSPISTTLYNYFCVHTDRVELKKIKNQIIIFATLIVACAFPAKFVLETFLTRYMEAGSVIFYLFASQIFYIIIKCFYVNLYKAQKKQKIYFAKLVTVIVLGFILNALLYAIIHTKEAFAIGTMLCGIIWFILSELDFIFLRANIREISYLTFASTAYIIIGLSFESVLGLFIYLAVVIVLLFTLMRKDTMEIIDRIHSMF